MFGVYFVCWIVYTIDTSKRCTHTTHTLINREVNKMDKKRNGKYYYHGYEVSSYGQENGYVDYATFSKSFDAVLCNNIIEVCNKLGDYSIYDNMSNGYYYTIENPETGYTEEFDTYSEFEDWRADLEIEHGVIVDDEPEEVFSEVYQWYLVPDTSWNRDDLEQAHQVYTYCESLDCLVWGVTHWGTSWDYVLTDIKLTDSMFYEGV